MTTTREHEIKNKITPTMKFGMSYTDFDFTGLAQYLCELEERIARNNYLKALEDLRGRLPKNLPDGSKIELDTLLNVIDDLKKRV